jgi:hypothetical protein
VTPEVFIATWQTSSSAFEVAERLQMPKDIVHARASTYRQAGIKLKKMPRHRNKALDVARLNRIIDEIEQEKGRAGQADPPPAPKKGEEPIMPEDVRSIVRKVLEAQRRARDPSFLPSQDGGGSKKTET